MEFKNLLFDVEEGVATITFNRPKAMNAMNTETMNELMDAIQICKKDDSIKSLILTGAGGKSFIAGGDIAGVQDVQVEATTRSVVRERTVGRGRELLRGLPAIVDRPLVQAHPVPDFTQALQRTGIELATRSRSHVEEHVPVLADAVDQRRPRECSSGRRT